ncbi:MAG: site-specific integrase [Pseudomonadota bacterium]
MLNVAERDLEWIDKAPSIFMFPESEERVRWLTQEEFSSLLDASPEHLKAPIIFTGLTGLRKPNVYGLTWQQIDLERRCAWVEAAKTKGKKSIAVPLNDQAIDLLKSLEGNHPTNVFLYNGRAFKGCGYDTWKNILKKAGITDFRWHDLRHTWASWHAQSGTSAIELIHLIRFYNDRYSVFKFKTESITEEIESRKRLILNNMVGEGGIEPPRYC